MINLDRKNFIENLNAIRKEDEVRDRIDEFIGEFNSGFTVFEPLPCENRLLALTEEMMNDKYSTIAWYLYEADKEEKIEVDAGTYTIKDDNDLYDFFSIIEQPEDDIAYYIAEKFIDSDYSSVLEDLGLSYKNTDDRKMVIYMFICNETEKVINAIKDKFDDYKAANLIVELKTLEFEIRKDRIDKTAIRKRIEEVNDGRWKEDVVECMVDSIIWNIARYGKQLEEALNEFIEEDM